MRPVDAVVADTSILIDLTRESAGSVAFARAGPSERILVHPASEAEVLVGALDADDLRAIVERLARFRRVRVNADDFDHCLAFIRRYALSHGVGWPDCLIAATAVRLGIPVATLNDKHFRVFRGLRVVRPY